MFLLNFIATSHELYPFSSKITIRNLSLVVRIFLLGFFLYFSDLALDIVKKIVEKKNPLRSNEIYNNKRMYML